ncbi:hypothetical protein CEXT_57221 [Caerostris extrusa]|uniref:Uncharacterized protein n=1 Tax=Caerostris extrusa TaxID=172846 RepID=A0AAV4ME66_CAEEX|nr:hypothetical protein CEXT_57221 [Caerostris extrusa]
MFFFQYVDATCFEFYINNTTSGKAKLEDGKRTLSLLYSTDEGGKVTLQCCRHNGVDRRQLPTGGVVPADPRRLVSKSRTAFP